MTCSAPAWAQSTGIAVDRFVPAAGPDAFLQAEGDRVPQRAELWVGTSIDALARPLVLRNAYTGDEVAVPVRQRVGLDVAAEIGLGRGLSLGLGLPLSLWQSGDRLQRTGGAPGTDPAAPLAPAAVSDIRLRGKAQLFDGLAGQLGLALLIEVTAPAGGQHDFVATGSPTVAPRLLLGGRRTLRRTELSAATDLGVRVAAPETLYLTSLHISLEWSAALAACWALPRATSLGLIGEAAGLAGLGTGGPYPAELRAALRLGAGRVVLDLGGGGAPREAALAAQWRVLALVRVRVQALPAGRRKRPGP